MLQRLLLKKTIKIACFGELFFPVNINYQNYLLKFENITSYRPFYDGIIVCVSDLLVASLHVEYLESIEARFLVAFCPEMCIDDQ